MKKKPAMADWIIVAAFGVLLIGLLSELARRLGVPFDTWRAIAAVVLFGFTVNAIREVRQ